MKIKKIIAWIIILIGFAFLFVKAFGDFTGFAVAENLKILPDYTYLIGLVFVVVGVLIMGGGRDERKKKYHTLKDIIYDKPGAMPLFDTDEEGVENIEELTPFRARTSGGVSYFVHVGSKKEAADLANYLVGAGATTIFMDKKALKKMGNKARSTNRRRLIEEITRALGPEHKIRLEGVAFGKREYDTKYGAGRGWEVEAHYDENPPKEEGIHFSHYNFEDKPKGTKKKINLHILITRS